MDKVEFLILRNLLHNEDYVRKVIPFIKSEYFEDTNQKIVFEEILSFIEQYNQPATKEVLCIEVEKRKDINDTSFKEIVHLIQNLDDVPIEIEWLIDTTEKWCRDRAIYIALMESIHIADGKDEKKKRGPCFNLHAADTRSGHRHARLRPHRSGSLRCLWWFQQRQY